MDVETVLGRFENSKSQYEVLKYKVEADVETAVREFISEYHLDNGVYLSPTTKRYYPYSNLASHVIGFVNDNGGAYGLEAQYEDLLAGTSGRVVTAKNAKGSDLLQFFEDYQDAENGSNLVLTLDVTIQHLCENYLSQGIAEFDVRNGGFCIAMDPNTGAILGMASSPDYDLNNYSAVDDPVLQSTLEGLSGDEYTSALTAARNKQWRSKILNDTYEPGSTFKSVVLASALEEGVISEDSTFYCSGSVKVQGYPKAIQCSNHSGHGAQTLEEAVGNSCNPAFIAIGQALGEEKFYQYMEDFGFLEKTGVDIAGEGVGVVWSESDFNNVQLATASFGQRFTTTPLQLIAGVAATINGGYLYTPHVVQSITDDEGNVLQSADETAKRQVISEATSAKVREMLESVVDIANNKTGKNAYVAGYRIGGKTGTSQTLVDDELIVSFLGFAPADDPKIIVLMALDSPKVASPNSNYCTTGAYISGGRMVAPLVGPLIAEILDYMGVEKQYTESELNGTDVTVPGLTGKTLEAAKTELTGRNLTCRVVGDGDVVTDQMPASGAIIPGGSQVVLYLGEEKPDEQVEMPDLTGMTPERAKTTLANLGLYMKASGAAEYYTSSTKADSQSVSAGSTIAPGTVVTVHFCDTSDTGEANSALG
jgi:stage V sporulation protein D (sporulation-specific penicillin-binding protein)